MNAFFKDKSTVFAILADTYAILGVLFLSWDPYRIIGFYWLDNCVSVVFFIILYHILQGYRNIFLTLISTALSLVFIGAIMLIYLETILYFPVELSSAAKPLKLSLLFYPYFDLSVFLILSSVAHFHRLKKMLPLDRKEILPYNMISLVVGLIIIPAIFIVSGYLDFLVHNLKFSMILSLILFRNLIEYWRYRNLYRITSPASVEVHT